MTKQYQITRIYLIEAEDNEDIEEKWRETLDEWEFQIDEKIELIAETERR